MSNYYRSPESGAFTSPLTAAIYMAGHPGPMLSHQGESIEKMRENLDRYFHAPLLAQARTLYPTVIEEKTIAGVRTSVVTPKGREAAPNQHRVLINLHGGGFKAGAGMGGLVESVPIAGAAQIKVISVDYREAPEYKFPAASEDVASVYKELLRSYKPENIGMYGCSAGGFLTAQSMAWLQKSKLPKPGAIGIFAAGGDIIAGGDSNYTAVDLFSDLGPRAPPPLAHPNPPGLKLEYFSNANPRDPLVSPVFDSGILSGFPQTLLITGSRDARMSSTIYLHTQLVKAGVAADLHVWEGMDHCFFYYPDLPESKEAVTVIADFFKSHLGR